MPPRSRRSTPVRPARPAEDPARSDTLRESMRQYLAEVEGQLTQRIATAILKPERIAPLVANKLGDISARIGQLAQKMDESHAALRKELQALAEESCKSDLQSVKDEIATLRDDTSREVQSLWAIVTSLQKESAQEANVKREPEEVRFSQDEVQSVDSRKGKGHTKSRSRKSRALTKSHTTKSRRKRRQSIDSDDSLSRSDESDAEVSGPERDDIRVADKDCRRILSVDRYRLLDREPERDLRLRTSKVLAQLKHLYEGDRFDGSDPLTLLHFLDELKTAFDEAALCEGDAKHMVRYFLDGEAARLFKGLTSREKKSYPRIVKWLLRTYVRESMLLDAREKFLTRSQKPTETELEYSNALSDLSMRCAGLISERDLINRFVRGLSPAIRTHVQDRVKRNTSWAIAVAMATDHGTARREAQKEGKHHRELSFAPYSQKRYAPGRGKAFAVQPEAADDDSHSDAWWERDPGPTAAAGQARDAIGAIQFGPRTDRREGSIAALETSATSSEEKYYTPRTTYVGSADRRLVSPSAGQKVMLPRGVPFPQKRPQQGGAPTGTLPCLGCGQLGHWLADCPHVNSRLKDLALETLRSRKQARKISFSDSRSLSPARRPTVLVAADEEPTSAPDGKRNEEEEAADAD